MTFLGSFFRKYKDWILIIFSIIVFYTIMPILNKKRIEERVNTSNEGVFSIAKILEFRTETRSDFYRYSFYFNNKFFKDRCYCGGSSSSLIVGQEYFIIIDPEKPGYNNFLLYNYSVPDSITSAPPEGWKELPIPVDKEEIRKFLEDY